MKRTAIARRTPLRAIQAPSKQRRPRNTGPTAATVQRVRERDGHACAVCGGPGPFQTHHRRPRAMGGTSDPGTNLPSNLLTLDERCHRLIETDPDMMRKAYGMAGWKTRQGRDPAMVRVLHARFGSGFLTEAGGWSYEPPPGFTPQSAA